MNDMNVGELELNFQFMNVMGPKGKVPN